MIKISAVFLLCSYVLAIKEKMWCIGCFCRIFLNVKNTTDVCVSFMFDIIPFSFHMRSLKSKYMKSSKKIFYSPFIQQQKQQKKRFWTALLWKLGNSGILSTATFFIVGRIKWQKFLFTYASYILMIHMSLLNFTHPCLCMQLTFWYNQ